MFTKLRLQNSRDESFWDRREKEEDAWRMYVETLYRPNEAVKCGRRHIITAYKAARKILPILGYIARGIAHTKDKKMIRKGKGHWREEAKCLHVFFLLRSCEDWLASGFSFSLTSEIRSIEPRYTDGLEFPARGDPWPLLPGSSRMFRYTRTTSQTWLDSFETCFEKNFPLELAVGKNLKTVSKRTSISRWILYL